MTIGFIGLGNMADAMIGGILKTSKDFTVTGSSKTEKTAIKMAEKYGIKTCTNNKEIAKGADILILAVKPFLFSEVIREIKDSIKDDVLIVSIAAGLTVAQIEEMFGRELKLSRCMPNTPALVGEGCTAVVVNKNVSVEEKNTVLSLMSSFGKAFLVEERLMDSVIAVSGSSPAYVFMFIEAMADGAVLGGMPRDMAYEFAAQAVLGSAKMVLETKKHPGALKDMVCSPSGTTIEAVKVLEEKGLRAAVIDAEIACMNKNKNM